MNFYPEKLALIRKSKKITQKQLATYLGRSSKSVYLWEKGIHTPSLSEIKRIAEVLEIQTNEFTNIEDDAVKNKPIEIFLNALDETIQQYGDLPAEVVAKILQIRKHTADDRYKVGRLTQQTKALRTLLDRISSFVFILNKDQRIVEFNEAFQNYTKKSQEEIIKSRLFDLFPKNQIHNLNALIQNVYTLKTEIYKSFKIQLPYHRTGLISIYPELDFNEDIISVTLIIDDITEKELLEKLNLNLNDCMNYVDYFIWVYSPAPKPKYLYINDGVSKVTGFTKEHFINDISFWRKHVYKEDLPKVKAFEKRKTFPREIEYRAYNSKGEITWQRTRVFKEVHNNRERIIGFTRDITNRKALERDRDALAHIVNKVNEVLWVGQRKEDNSFEYLYISDNIKEMHNLSKEKAYNDPRAWIDTIHPRDRVKVLEQVNRQEGQPAMMDYRVVFDNGVKWVSNKIEKSGNLVYGIIRDITARKVKERKILKLVKEDELLTTIINSIPNHIIWISSVEPSPVYLFISDSFNTITGYKKEDFISDVRLWLSYIHEEDRERIREILSKDQFPQIFSYKFKTIYGIKTFLSHNYSKKIQTETVYFGIVKDITKGNI